MEAIEDTRRDTERNRYDGRKKRHSQNGADAKHEHVEHPSTDRRGALDGEENERRRARHAVDDPHREGTHAIEVAVSVLGWTVSLLSSVGVGVEVLRPILVLMGMEVYAVLPEPSQDIAAERYEHHAHGELETRGETLRHHAVQHQHDGSEYEEREGVTGAPKDTLPDALRRRLCARGQTRDRGNVIRFDGMTHSDQKTEEE